MVKELNPITWHSNRELPTTPIHFTVTKTPLTQESKLWILQNLVGRFSVITIQNDLDITSSFISIDNFQNVPAFEDPKEAVFYELTWA